jgi:ABC-2 type transport system permease protein
VRWLWPGSFLWLLAHEIRISIRGSIRANRLGVAITAILIGVLTIFAGLPLAVALAHRTVALTPIIALSIDAAVVALFTLLLSQTLSSATLALYERGDLDLLLSSPIPARRVLAVRAVAIAVSPLTIFLSLLGPVVVPAAFFGHAPWLASIGVLFALGFAASALGLLIAMGLFALIGPRRTRVAGQLLAAVIGAALFLLGQSRYYFAGQGIVWLPLFKRVAASDFFHEGSPFTWPAMAVAGAPLPFAAFCGLSLLLFALSTSVLGARFSKDASVAAGVDSGASAARRMQPLRKFRSGVSRALIRKELLLLKRDPMLLSQVILRVFYLIPIVFLVLRNASLHNSGQVVTGTGALVFIASQLSASLAWIAISAEDAAELLESAPVTRRTVRRAKLSAALLPLAVMLIAPIAFLTYLSPWVGLIAALGVVASSGSAGLINIWYEVPTPRKLFRRRGTGSLVANIAALFLGLAWSATASAGAFGTPWALAGVALTLLILFGFYRGRITARA